LYASATTFALDVRHPVAIKKAERVDYAFSPSGKPDFQVYSDPGPEPNVFHVRAAQWFPLLPDFMRSSLVPAIKIERTRVFLTPAIRVVAGLDGHTRNIQTEDLGYE